MRHVIVILLVSLMIAPAVQAAWPMEGAGIGHHGQVDEAAPGSLDGTRSMGVGARMVAQVIEGPAGLAIATSQAGHVAALTASGQTAWKLELREEVRSSALWTGEILVVAPRGEAALGLDPLGRELWQVPIDNDRDVPLVRMASPVLHTTGDVIVADLGGQVHRISPDGAVTWSSKIASGRGTIQATPTVTPAGDILVASFISGQEDRGTLHLLDGDTGEPIWGKQVGSQVVAAPAVSGTLALVPLRDGRAVAAYELDDGSLSWTTRFDNRVTASPSLHQGLALVGDAGGLLQALRVRSGEVAWTFNPLQDDPRADALVTGSVALALADAVAIDGDGHAWVPYWAVDLTKGFPPQDSVASPFYLLDARTGERLDRTTLPKASHGASLHTTGIWAGNDDGKVRHWALPGTLQVHAFRSGGQVHLVVNTDASGAWSVDWGTGAEDGLEEGTGALPIPLTRELAPGTHTLTVTTEAGTATTQITVPGAGQDDPSSLPGDLDPEPVDQDPSAGQGEEEGNGTPLAPLVAVLALVVAAGGRRRG